MCSASSPRRPHSALDSRLPTSYLRAMIQRYSRPAMRAIWTDENKLRIWLQIELLVTEALVKEGIVPQADFERIKSGADYFHSHPTELVERQKELEKTLNHDVVGFTTAVAERINHPASRWLHFGLTSSDIVDTAFAVQLVQSADILIPEVKELRKVIARRAKEYMLTPCVGRSHGIHAEPTTFGLKLALMYDEFGRAHERLERIRDVAAVGKLSGAVGTSAHLSPAVEAAVCRHLGLRPAPVATQIVHRDIHAEFMNTLALVGASIERWAVEFRHLQRTEVLETEEPFTQGQKGSSAMPHKRNPVTWERLTGLARILRGNAIAAMEDVALWHERDISHSSVERIIFPDSTVLADYLLDRTATLIEKLVVYPDRMKENLELSHGLIYSGELLLALVEKNVTREDAYQWVQRNAMRVWDEGGTFKEKVLSDPDIRKALKSPDIEKIFEASRLLANVDRIFQRVFG